jgi:hypothetical protein
MSVLRCEFGSAFWTGVGTFVIGACLAMGLAAQQGHAATLFSYDPAGGQLPTDQGWQASEVDTTGPLTAANTAGTAADNSNAAIVNVSGTNVLQVRDTLTDTTTDLPNYYYAWTTAQQQALITGGMRLTFVAQALTSTSNNSTLRLGFNNTEFETQFDNIGTDQAIQVQTLGSLFTLDGLFHTVVVTGKANGSNYEFSYTLDGGAPVALSLVTNPTPTAYESTVYFGAFSSPGRTSDLLVKSVVMEALPEPGTAGLALLGACLTAGARRRMGTRV